MKKIITLLLLASAAIMPSMAQKFALVDMEYILKNIPAYERANEQLNQTSKKWQAEVEAVNLQAQTLYKNYQNEVVFLSAEQKKTREEEILKKKHQTSRKNISHQRENSSRSVRVSLDPSKTKSTMPSRP